jgi:hypothetical protein
MSGGLVAQIPAGIASNPQQFAQEDTTEQKVEDIRPWQTFREFGFQKMTDDSLLRWEIWPNWGDYYAYRNDVVSYRQGTIGRLDAFDIDGYSPLEQKVRLNGITLNNPVTGYVNYNHIPANRVGVMSELKGTNYQSNIRLRDFYILEPLSYLNFDESALDYRNLEFMVTQNFRERTNAEISFWDRRDGGSYPDNNVQGSQILFRAYHYLNQNMQVRGMILRNQFERDESFGYVVNNPQTFAFSQFSTQSNRANRSSDNLRRDLSIGLYARADSLSEEKWGVELYQSKNEFRLPFTVDTLNWDIRSQALKGFRSITAGGLNLKGDIAINRYFTKKRRNIGRSSWGLIEAGVDAQLNLFQNLSVYNRNEFNYRTDEKIGFQSDLGFQTNGRLRANLNFAVFSRIPTIQQMYWRSNNFSGVDSLENTSGISLSSTFETNLGNQFEVGISGRLQVLDNDVFKGTDSSFVNSDSYSVISATLYGSFENHRFTLESSGTVHAATATEPNSVLDANNKPDQKFWFRNNAYVRGYVFDRAAYVKLGLLTTFSPLPYRARLYNTELQFWENAALNEVEIPAFFRMDAELSARLRSMMILMRWENVLDGFGQAGYFEAATLPMPGRRLIVGIRAQFRN